jgi:hypothetical protein
VSAVLVIGSQGALGSTVVRAFERAGWEVHRAARRPGTSFRLVDLGTPDTLRRAFDGIDVVVNTVPHAGLAAERAVLERGGLLLNISALPASEAAGLPASGTGTVVMNSGLAPGVTNLVAADLVARHPDADGIELALTLSASATSGPAGGEFVYRHLTSSRRHATATIPFPPPIGERRCVEIAEGENGWLGAAAGGRSVRTYLCISEPLLHRGVLAANRTGVMSLVPRAAFVGGRKGPPGDASTEPFSEWVAVLRSGRRLTARTVEGEGDYRSTAAATVVVAEALLRRGDLPGGRFDPEDLLSLGDVSAALEAAGIRVVERSATAP